LKIFAFGVLMPTLRRVGLAGRGQALNLFCVVEGGIMSDSAKRETNSGAPTRRQWVMGAAAALAGFSVHGASARELLSTRGFGSADESIAMPHAADSNGVTRTAEAIHQETTYKASPQRVYEALTDSAQFQKVELASGAMKPEDLNGTPAKISTEPGGAFSLFGGYITGRQIELVPAKRIVQAWRPGHWPAGWYSIAHFELVADGAGTKIILDHLGFPVGDADSLASGWQAHYWDGLTKFFA
jgi:activator of HSP90 ATPase